MVDLEEITNEELRALINKLQEELRTREGKTTKQGLAEMISPTSDNFLGSGMTMAEYTASHELERLKVSFFRQEKPERKRRINLIARMGAEYERILVKTHFSTAYVLAAIEAVVDGTWRDLKIDREFLTFVGEDQSVKDTYVPIFANFVNLIDEALATVPGDESTRH